MIVINVGGFKTGSTWVHNILRELLETGKAPPSKSPIPEQLAGFVTPKVQAKELWDALDAPRKTFLHKIHFHESTSCALPEFVPPHVKFVNIVRNPKDTLVSHYYHDIGVGRFSGSFADYFNDKVDDHLRLTASYNRYWGQIDKALPNQVHTIRYERLKRKFHEEVGRLISFLGINATPETVAHLYDLDANREVGTSPWMEKFSENGQSFYRKGIIGDHWRHFSLRQQLWFLLKHHAAT